MSPPALQGPSSAGAAPAVAAGRRGRGSAPKQDALRPRRGIDGLAQEAGRHSRHGLLLSLAGGDPQDKVLVLHWISTLRARALDVHVKLLFLTCSEGQKPQELVFKVSLNTKYFIEETTVSCASEVWQFGLKNLHSGIKFDTKTILYKQNINSVHRGELTQTRAEVEDTPFK